MEKMKEKKDWRYSSKQPDVKEKTGATSRAPRRHLETLNSRETWCFLWF